MGSAEPPHQWEARAGGTKSERFPAMENIRLRTPVWTLEVFPGTQTTCRFSVPRSYILSNPSSLVNLAECDAAESLRGQCRNTPSHLLWGNPASRPPRAGQRCTTARTHTARVRMLPMHHQPVLVLAAAGGRGGEGSGPGGRTLRGQRGEGCSGPVPRSRSWRAEGLSARPPGPPAPSPRQALPLAASVGADFLFPVIFDQMVLKTP